MPRDAGARHGVGCGQRELLVVGAEVHGADLPGADELQFDLDALPAAAVAKKQVY